MWRYRHTALRFVLVANLISHSVAYALMQTGSGCPLPGSLADPGKINASLIVECLRNDQPIQIKNAEITGDLDLTSLGQGDLSGSIQVAVPVIITDSRFTGMVIGSNTEFKQVVNFSRTQFKNLVDFSQTQFDAGVSFNQADFSSEAYFFLTQFSGGADFIETHFRQGANFLQARFAKDSNAFFLKAIFDGDTLFNSALFAAPAIFTQTKFKGSVQFDGAVFQDDASFREASFERATPNETVSFTGASLTMLDINKAQFAVKQLDLSSASYKSLTGLTFNPDVLAESKDADIQRTTLVNLESNFRSQNLLSIANEIAYQRHLLERKAKPPALQGLEYLTLDLPFGYGLKPMRTILASLILILFFSLFYYPVDTIRPAPVAPPKPRERRLAMRISEMPVARDDEFPDLVKKEPMLRQKFPRISRALQAIIFSFGVFTKISWGEFVAVKHKTVVLIEWLLGLVMLGGLVFALTNTNPLVNALFKAIF